MDKEFWNNRYGQHPTVYGDEPNEFFKAQIKSVKPGKLLLPAEGEGRNAIYAASLGWTVTAYDFSEVAKAKTLERAASLGISRIDYQVYDLGKIKLPGKEFDAVALIYVHLPMELRKHLHLQCKQSLKPGGKLIFESFSKDQLKYNTGGPKDSALLHSMSDIHGDFANLRIDELEEKLIELKEGSFHSGPASVVRLTAFKI
ncbi:MAG: class I SAM-dependent methyltransferase [Cytophagales bacterium]|nr:class I SAM-dependent methyltransferase [Cytophagales bacterium]MCA6367332.1 class I SAM-dependent methyltransferase [Cytophagales bacterium]MCA6376183.1 class I SAM-dependent methyltransferase [Cytophagales bacterium]